jgi:Domain of unknown function (DUF4396)
MLNGVILWFVLTAASLLFVAVDIRSTPEHPVLKWGFVLITAYLGPVGAFLYVLGCREPLPGLHETYVSARWRQVLGSTMHCVAGDGVGILTGAVIGTLVQMPPIAGVALEYVLGFAFGWTVFQSLFMKGMAGGSYRQSLSATFIPELLSMNFLMAGMVPVMTLTLGDLTGSHDPAMGAFWFRMSMALLAGFVIAYPMNWWLVSNHLKHGMMTVRHAEEGAARTNNAERSDGSVTASEHRNGRSEHKVGAGAIALMATLSFLAFGMSVGLSWMLGGL